MRLLGLAASLTSALALAGGATAMAAPTVVEFPAGLGANGLTRGVDGNVWFADTPNPGAIGRITPGGTVTTFTAGLTKDAQPRAVAGASSGVWFTENGKNKVGRVAADGSIAEWPAGPHDHPTGITAGPDGNVWYVATGKGGAVARITPTGTVTEFTAGLTSNGNLQDIALGPDGSLWFTAPATSKIGRITTAGTITEFPGTGLLSGGPQKIAAGPDGALWFTMSGVTAGIGRISTSGAVTTYTTGLLLGSAPEDIAAGSDGNLYFTDPGANAIGQITPSGDITEIVSGITSSAGLAGIAAGGDGRMWFGESSKGKVGRLSVAPAAGVAGASSVTDVTAELSASVSPNSEATSYRFEWGATSSYGQMTAVTSAGSGAAAQAATASLSGLAPSTTYHVRLVATNATGTTAGPDATFTTTATGAPSATTEAATDVSAHGATLNAVVNPENGVTTYQFEWTTDASYAPGDYDAAVPSTPAAVGADGTPHAVSFPVSGLEPNTTYHYRVVASSATGSSEGADRTFTTDAVAPAVTTAPASAVSASSAILAGAVEPGNSLTSYRFEWGTTDLYGSAVPLVDGVVGDGLSQQPVSEALTGLAPSTTYHFRLVATSNAGVTAGPDQTFTTAGVAPDAATAAADAVTATSARLHAAVDPRNDAAATYRFEWGATTAYGHAVEDAPIPGTSAAGSREVWVDISGLEPATLYHFRVVATSASGTTQGQDAWFTTESAPVTAPSSTETGPGPTSTVPSPEPEPSPDLAPRVGKTAVADVVAGTVRIRLPGSATSVPLDGAAAIPSGSVIDARGGKLALETALDARGRRQEAQFGGAMFRVALAKKGGMVDLTLTERPTGCPRHQAAGARPRAAMARKKRKRVPSLWGKDSRGKYRTHGRNSVATVRGTEWVTTETCAGTLTRVVHGAVAVRDLRTKEVRLVRAGHRYLARARR